MRVAPALLFLLLPLFTSGCIGALHSTQPVQQYVLRPQPPANAGATSIAAVPAANAGNTLQVLLPIAAAGLSGQNIAVLRAGQRLDYYTGSSWAEAAPLMLQMLAVESLRQRSGFSLVESDAGPFSAQYVLSLELTHFEADYRDSGPPTVHVALVCTLGRRATRSAVVSITAQSEVVASADRMQAVVAAFERATEDALAQMAAAIVPSTASSTAAAAAP